MALRLTPELLAATYEMLRTTAPFRRWRLSHADDVVFRVVRGVVNSPETWAQHLSPRQRKGHPYPGRHLIDMNERKVGTLSTLVVTMAHEMCHVRESIIAPYSGESHGALFWKLAAQVCRCHAFDLKAF